MEQTEVSENLALTLQTPVNNQEESTRHSENGESLKLKILFWFLMCSFLVNSAYASVQTVVSTFRI
jgi:hypothetical protein